MQPEADELLAAFAPEAEAEEHTSFASESESASDDGSEQSIVRDTGGGICSIC